MTIGEFVSMLQAVEAGQAFSVGFQLQHSSDGGATLQEVAEKVGPGRFADFMERVEEASAPTYGDEGTDD